MGTRQPLRVLAMEPYYGGSHKPFLDGWIARSRHMWTLLHLPAAKWKWRMRHSAITFTDDVRTRLSRGERWDVLFCSDMLNLAEFKGLAPAEVQGLPAIIYFHENQLTYPVRERNERDYHFMFSNMTSALAATQVWFNSAFHRDSFLDALDVFLARMPDFQPVGRTAELRAKSSVRPPGIDNICPPGKRAPGPLRILWAARWEFDKAPERFFKALHRFEKTGIAFEISVIGGSGGRDPLPVFGRARRHFRNRIRRWGYQPTRDDYVAALREADVIVSTADHEFFGISVMEAVAAGSFPVLPRRLAYPELFDDAEDADRESFFYAGGDKALAAKLAELADRFARGDLWQGDPDRGRRVTERYMWDRVVPEWDGEVGNVMRNA